jgi:hypothetical protein
MALVYGADGMLLGIRNHPVEVGDPSSVLWLD